MSLEDPEIEDYYTFFNLPKDADNESIKRAFYRLSRMYHPDRHSAADEELIRHAERLFAKTKRIYEVLSDPTKRAIYDTVGSSGLDMDGWEIATRDAGSAEIKAEYERIKAQKEREAFEAATNPTGAVSISLNATDVFDFQAADEDYDEFGEEDAQFTLPDIEFTSLDLHQAVDIPTVSQTDRLNVGGYVGTHNGTGDGGLRASWTRAMTARMWGQVECVIGLNNNYLCSCKLSRNLSKHMLAYIQLIARLDRKGFHPGLQLGFNRQLTPRIIGSMTGKFGLQNSVTTSLTWDDQTKRQMIASLTMAKSGPSKAILFLMLRFTHRFEENKAKFKCGCKIGTMGVVLDAGYDRSIDEFSRAGAKCVIHANSRLSVQLSYKRGGQAFDVTILLCDGEVTPAALMWGVVAPVIAYNLAQLALRPWLEKRSRKLKDELQAKTSSLLTTRREESEATQRLMRDAASRIRSAEEEVGGLVIMDAVYGKVWDGMEANLNLDKTIDVTVSLQSMVLDSKLIIYEKSKLPLPGFCDPCPGDTKRLKIKYKFHGLDHLVIVNDDEPVLLPKQSHQL